MFLFYPLTGLGGLKRCFSNLFKPIKNFRKKNIFSNIFMGQKYSDSRWLYRLSMRILESDTLCPLTLTLIALGLLCQHIIYTRLFMDERSLQYFRNSLLRLNPRPEEFHKASGFLQMKLQHPVLQNVLREWDSRLSSYLGRGGKLALLGGSELIKFYPQIPLLRFNHLLSLHNYLILKYF